MQGKKRRASGNGFDTQDLLYRKSANRERFYSVAVSYDGGLASEIATFESMGDAETFANAIGDDNAMYAYVLVNFRDRTKVVREVSCKYYTCPDAR